MRTVLPVFVCDLIALARFELKGAAIHQICCHLPFNTKNNMSLGAPMICDIPGRIIDKSDANVGEMLCSPCRVTGMTLMGFCWNGLPVSYAERNIFEVHGALSHAEVNRRNAL